MKKLSTLRPALDYPHCYFETSKWGRFTKPSQTNTYRQTLFFKLLIWIKCINLKRKLSKTITLMYLWYMLIKSRPILVFYNEIKRNDAVGNALWKRRRVTVLPNYCEIINLNPIFTVKRCLFRTKLRSLARLTWNKNSKFSLRMRKIFHTTLTAIIGNVRQCNLKKVSTVLCFLLMLRKKRRRESETRTELQNTTEGDDLERTLSAASELRFLLKMFYLFTYQNNICGNFYWHFLGSCLFPFKVSEYYINWIKI